MNYGAFGLVEVVGSSNAILVIDQMLKTSDVSFLTWQTKCGGHATVFLTGDVSAVTAAVDSVKGNPPCEIVASAVKILRPSGTRIFTAEYQNKCTVTYDTKILPGKSIRFAQTLKIKQLKTESL